MNNCRAGLYSFAPTTTWLHEIGLASPPLFVILGLTLPDSRILSGIASIGLTLANIAIILPHLRRPILDSIILAHAQSARGQITSSLERSNITPPVDLVAENPALALVSPCETDNGTIRSICSADMGPPCYPKVVSNVVLQTMLLPPTGDLGDNQTSPQPLPSPDADSSELRVSFNLLFAGEGRGALYIPLPAPDTEEVAFFDMENDTLSNSDLGDSVAALGQRTDLEEPSTMEVDEPWSEEEIDEDYGRLVVADRQSTGELMSIGEASTDITMFVAEEKVATLPTNPTVQGHHDPAAQGAISYIQYGSSGESAAQSTLAGHSLVGRKESLRPECLEFVPQSVISRYPSVSMISARYRFGVHQIPPRIFIRNPVMLLEGPRPRATLPGHWNCSFLNEIHEPSRSMERQTFVIGTTPAAQDVLKREAVSLHNPSTEHEPTLPQNHLTDRRRLGVLARAALRDRRSAVRRRGSDGDDGSSTSGSDSELDSDSESSSRSPYESMLPHMLGTDLIAALDANSESGLKPARSEKTTSIPLNVYKDFDFLTSEDSAADVSMVMHVSSIDGASEGGTRASFRYLTHEDIRRWASGVLQKCVGQVCRNRVPVEPSSPSQVSDICAERPSGSGGSQCPLSGLHCKLGAITSTQVPAPRNKELLVSIPVTSILPTRKPPQVRNLRDIPEFVPRQRQVSTITGCVGGPRRLTGSTKSTMDTTRDAVTRAIARMESQAGFNARQWLVGTEKRMVNTAGGRQGTLRCA